MVSRRTVLKWGAGALALPVFQAMGFETTASGSGRLVVVFLRGGMDGLFAFSPVDDARFAGLRPGLSQRVVAQGIRLKKTGFAAHPACKGMAALFDAGQLAFAPCAGTTDTSRSHFQAQDFFELGTGSLRTANGFMGRAATALGNTRGAISFTQDIPLCFRGDDVAVEVAPLSGSGLALPPGPALDAIRQAHRERRTGQALEQAIATAAEVDAAMAGTMAATGMDPSAARGAAPAGGFALQAMHMGRILRGNTRLSLSFIDIGGWDTHARQEETLAKALASLADGLGALQEALGEDEWRRTRVVVMSEFGRTVRENGTKGTDHGHGGLFLLAGGAINGGRMIGDFGGLADKSLNEKRDLPVLADWRALLGETMRQTWDFNAATLNAIFPGMPRQRILL